MGSRIVVRQLGEHPIPAEEFPVESLRELVFGREADCQVRFDEDGADMVSRHHARITVARQDPPELMLSDLNSRNGTFVNGRRIQGEVRLATGDKVQLGPGGPEFAVEVASAGQTKAVQVPPQTSRSVSIPEAHEVRQPAPSAVRPPSAPPPPVAQVSASPTRRVMLYGGLALAAEGLVSGGTWMFGQGKGVASYKIYHQRLLMSACYKTYGNPSAVDGRYWFARVVLQNTGKASLKNVKVSYQIPEFITWTTPDEAPEILPGATAVFVYYPKFTSKITQLRSRTPAVLETKIEYNDGSGVQTKIEKREFEIFGLTEFSYTSVPDNERVSYYDNWANNPLLASYIQDEDPVVKTFYAKMSEVSGGITVMKDAKALLTLLQSNYNFMVSLGMTYSGAKGVPDQTGDVGSLVQSIRVPRDLIYGNSGLCIELAILWVTLAQVAGAKGYLVMVPGHCFPVLEAENGDQFPIEATAISGSFGGNMGRASTWQQAVEYGLKELKDYRAAGKVEDFIDVQNFQSQGIRPPELPDADLPELVKLLDDRRAKRVRPIEVRRPPWWRF